MQLYYHIAVPCHGYILGFVPCGSANSTNPMNVHYLRKDMSNMFLYNIFWVLQNSFPSGFMYRREVKNGDYTLLCKYNVDDSSRHHYRMSYFSKEH